MSSANHPSTNDAGVAFRPARMMRTLALACLGAALALAVMLTVWGPMPARAQALEGWSDPIRLSTWGGNAGEANMVSDTSGRINAFWAERTFDTDRSLIYYSQFDGRSWTEPNAIYASWPGTPINSMAVALDPDNEFHLVWTEGLGGPVFQSRAALEEAGSARAWSEPENIGLPAKELEMGVDKIGTIHIVYLVTDAEAPGIYYTQSQNQGRAWTYPLAIDPDKPSTAVPDKVDLALDDQGGVHVVWSYSDESSGTLLGRWIRYSHLLSASETWSTPETMDMVEFGEEFLHIPQPGIAVVGSTVHVIWGATHNREPGVTGGRGGGASSGEPDASVNRFHRMSEDRGVTWGEAQPVFGDLLGQALGDGLAVDGDGRLHFASQLRWPQGVYHAIWNGSEWSTPDMVYLIRQDSDEEFLDRVHAHRTRIAVFAGGHLVVTFTPPDGTAQSVLYAMHELVPLDELPSLVTDVPATKTAPAPTGESTTAPAASAEAPVFSPSALDSAEPTPAQRESPAEPLWVGLLATAAVISLFVVVRTIRRR